MRHAHDAGFEVAGCDINSAGIAATKKLLPHAELEWHEFDKSSKTNLETVVSFDVMEHIPNVKEIFRLVFDRLKPNGHFIFLCPVYDGPLGVLVKALDKDPTHLFKQTRYWWL